MKTPPVLTSIQLTFYGARTLLLYLWLCVFALFWMLPSLIFIPLLPLKLRHRWVARPFCRMILWSAEAITGIHWRVVGAEHIPEGEQRCVILAKHQSSWETFMLPVLLYPQVQVAKQELTKAPLFGWLLKHMHPILIDRMQRAQALKQLVKDGAERLHNGFHILIFPEGSRVPPGTRKAFSKGAAMLAVKNNAPVLAVAHNAGEFWPHDHWIKRPGTITVVISRVIDTTNLSTQELHDQVEHWINSTVEEISSTKFTGTMITNTTSGKRF